MRLRHSVRGLLVDDDGLLLLYRFTVPGGGPVVWTPPGGGIEPGESPLDALARELDEETGLQDLGRPTHVWHQEVVDPTLLAAELVEHFEWWEPDRLALHRGPEVFGPRELPRLYAELVREGLPRAPLLLGC